MNLFNITFGSLWIGLGIINIVFGALLLPFAGAGIALILLGIFLTALGGLELASGVAGATKPRKVVYYGNEDKQIAADKLETKPENAVNLGIAPNLPPRPDPSSTTKENQADSKESSTVVDINADEPTALTF